MLPILLRLPLHIVALVVAAVSPVPALVPAPVVPVPVLAAVAKK